MIRVNLNYYIEKYNLNISQLSKETGISRKALTLLANYNDSEEPPVSIQYNTIETLCKYFKIGVDSLIEYEYSQEDFEILPVAYNLGKNKDI
ncbi:helix-turn-helix transcriptional regulator, partial [Enterococcus faecalis]|nr:helix-turn-helix transcriptional regulator [Enterococcus faecalis]